MRTLRTRCAHTGPGRRPSSSTLCSTSTRPRCPPPTPTPCWPRPAEMSSRGRTWPGGLTCDVSEGLPDGQRGWFLGHPRGRGQEAPPTDAGPPGAPALPRSHSPLHVHVPISPPVQPSNKAVSGRHQARTHALPTVAHTPASEAGPALSRQASSAPEIVTASKVEVTWWLSFIEQLFHVKCCA